MRLGQLARQLEIKPETIVSYLAKEKKIILKEHPNSKVEDGLVAILTAHFKPVEEEIEETPEKASSPVEEEKELIEEVVAEPEHIETVKAEAPQELKIIGKIDLPNKKEINVEVDGVVYDQETLDNKKKEELKAERERKDIEKEEKRKEEEEKKAKAREQRQIEQERQAMLETEKHNILTKEEEKKKALAIKAEQEREEKLETKRKAKQKDHYAQQVTTKTTVKKKKKVVEKEVVNTEEPVTLSNTELPKEIIVEDVREKSAYKRFIKWLNT